MSQILGIPETKITNEELVAEYLRGNENALEVLVQQNLEGVFNFVMQYAKDVNASEDITQDVFVKAWKNLEKFNNQYKFKTWLFTIAKNTALDYLRKRKMVPFSALEDEQFGLGPLSEQIILEPLLQQPVPQSFGHNGFSETKAAAENLPENYRNILFLHYDMGFNFREIAEKLKQSINTIKTQHRRAILALRKSLD